MRVYIAEFKKLIKSPCFYLILLFFVTINILALQGVYLDPKLEKSILIQEFLYDFLAILFKYLFVETAILCMMVGAVVFGEESSFDMEQMIYTTKRGRKIFWQKLWAAVSITLIIGSLLIAMSFGAFAWKAGYTEFWDIHMNCPFLHEKVVFAKIYSCLSDIPMWQYALAMATMLLMVAVIFTVFVVCIIYLASRLIKGVGACAIIIIIDYIISLELHRKYPHDLWQSSFAASYLSFKYWYTDGGGNYLFRYQDLWTMAILAGVTALLLIVCWVKFRRQNI